MNIEQFKSDPKIRAEILNLAQKKKQIIHGARAVNIQLPPSLRRKTKDYDVYTKNPEKSARELVKKLNKKYNDGFKVVEGVHKGTFKVKDKKGETIADYTQVTKHPKTINVWGVQYAKTGYAKRKLQKLIKDTTKEFRREKDIETLKRIERAKEGFKF